MRGMEASPVLEISRRGSYRAVNILRHRRSTRPCATPRTRGTPNPRRHQLKFAQGCRPYELAHRAAGPSVPQAKAEPPDEQALHYRRLAGLTPVKLDRKLSAGCMEHANYMLHNQGTDAMVGLNPHTQRANLPGASAAGAAQTLGAKRTGQAVAWPEGRASRNAQSDPKAPQ